MNWWENNFLRWVNNELYLGQKRAWDMAAENGTPLFVYSREQMLHNLSILRESFAFPDGPRVEIAYAMKANPYQPILQLMKEAGTYLDVVSPGEIKEAIEAGFEPERIIYTGTSVSEEDLQEVMRFPEITINIDAAEQIEIMERVRQAYFPRRRYRVSIRWNPGVGKGFNAKVTTAGVRSPDGTPIKFGVEAERVSSVFRLAAKKGFHPVGFHQHLGSGWTAKDWPVVKEAVARMITKAAELIKAGFKLEFLDFGGGIAPVYEKNQNPFPLRQYAQFIHQQISKANLPLKKIFLEPGKFLVADAGVLLMRVVYVKKSYGNYFVCVNAGTYNAIPRPVIYPEARHYILNCRARRGPSRSVTVAGHLCETGDVFAREQPMPLPKAGDILAVLHAGAYCQSMASRFNLREIPPAIMI